MKRITASSLIVLLIAGCTSQPRFTATFPDAAGAAIVGQVHDGNSPIPGATVTLSSQRHTSKVVITDGNGHYRFVHVMPDKYTLRVELSGFSANVQEVVVGSTSPLRLSSRLQPSSVAETITVTAAAPMTIDAMTTRVEGGVAGGVVGGMVGSRSFATYAVAAPAPPPPEPQYASIKDHGFIDTKREATTTFAIDVDRASYANVRRFLSSNVLPPANAVRVEEMINYFTYSLPQPTGAEPFSITTEVAGCPWNTQNRLLRIGIQGRNLEEWRMAPNNLVFLIDVSGSMQPPQRLPLIKSAFRYLVDQLRAEDKVSIVVYAGSEGLALPATSGADKSTILGKLDTLQAGGSTPGEAGIQLAYKVAQENFIKGGNNRVILATDGDFNVGVSSNGELEKIIEDKRKTGVFLTTLGVGDGNYHDARMELLADKGNGNYFYFDTLKEAEKVFRRELTGTLVTIAKDVKVQIEFNPAAVASYRQIGYENRALENKDFTDDTKDAGDLGAGHSVTALYEIVPAVGARGGELGQVRLRYKAPDGDTSQYVAATAVDRGHSAWDASADLQFAAAVAEFAMLLRKSPHKGTASYAEALQLARMSRGADLDGLREEFIRLVDSTRALSGGATPVAVKD